MDLFLITSPFLSLLFLLGFAFLTLYNTALLHMGRVRGKELLKSSRLSTVLFRTMFKMVFPKQEWEYLHLTLSFCKHIYQVIYAIFALLFLLSSSPSLRYELLDSSSKSWVVFLGICGIIVIISFLLDLVSRLISAIWSFTVFNTTSLIALIYLLPLFPWVGLCLKFAQRCIGKLPKIREIEKTDKTKLREIIRESELRHHLDVPDQKLISSFINFKERVVKEIMVPRVDLFSLSADTSIQEASELLSKEGYSRIPIYKETLDEIVGVVLYKDLLKCYTAKDHNLNALLETIAKPVLYAPENKKVSQLLQEFRTKQIHMAIVVDEYGGTEGIVTIEDILEELVGEIEDEYDIDEENPFWEIPGSGWIIDAKMTLLDIEAQIGIHIPTHPEYETLGGYVYHCAGTIPSKGWRLSHDQFDLEVISSNERAIKKIKILPRKNLS